MKNKDKTESRKIQTIIFLTALLLTLCWSSWGQESLNNGTWYRGNTHTHAKFSDKDTINDVPEIASWYREAGYNFLCLSEHNDHLTEKKTICHDEVPQGAGFIMICGNELSKSSHHTALGISSYIDSDTILQEGVKRTIEAGGVAILNHPMDPEITSAEFLATSGLNHLEIFNGGRPRDTPGSEMLWDSLLSASNGRIVFAVASDDNHYKKSNVGKGWIMVKAAKLTKENIVESIRAGKFYATTGIIISESGRTGDTFIVDSKNGESVEFIGKYGKVLMRIQGRSARYIIRGGEKYVRAKITNSMGQMAWTQPIMLE